MALPAFNWSGNTGAKATPGSVKRYEQIAAALAARGGAASNLGEGLARVGDALVYNSANSKAEAGAAEGAASRQAVIDALLANPDPSTGDIVGAMSNEWVSSDPGSSAVVQALLNQEQQQAGWARDDSLRAQDRGFALDDRNAEWAREDPIRDLQMQGLERDIAAPTIINDQAIDPATMEVLGDFRTPAAGPTPTDDQREYAQAVQQGFTGSLQDWIAAKPAAGGVTVNTGENGGAFQKKADENAAVRLGDIVTSGQGAATFMGDMQALAALSSQINTGKTAEIMNTLGPYAEALGVEIGGLGEGQAYQAIIDRLAPQMRPVGAGATSDFDARQFLSSLPSLGKNPDGNAIIMQTLSALQQHKMAAAEIAGLSFMPPEQGGITWQEAEKRIRELPNPYEGFNDYAKSNPTSAPAQDGEYPEGTVIEDNAGNQLILRNGQWEPVI